MIANRQVQSFVSAGVSAVANATAMAQQDRDLIERLVAHAGKSARKIARDAGLTPSTLTRPLNQPVKHRLSSPTLDKLKAAYPDFAEWAVVAAIPAPNAILAPPMEGASQERMKRDVPVYGTALGADVVVDGEAIEQAELNRAEIIDWRRRPVLLDGRADVYALYVQGSSMAPRHRDGAVLFVESRRPPSIGDDAVVYLRVPDDHDGERASAVLVKTLVKKTASFIELERYTPGRIFRLPADRVARMDRVITLDELTD